MANLKEIRNRISSVSSTMQITSAMKMVSAAKLKKAQDAITAMRPYDNKLTALLQNLNAYSDAQSGSKFAESRPVKTVLILAITSNRGLCGAFNSNIIKQTNQLVKIYSEKKVSVVAIGKKGNDVLSKNLDIPPRANPCNMEYAGTVYLAKCCLKIVTRARINPPSIPTIIKPLLLGSPAGRFHVNKEAVISSNRDNAVLYTVPDIVIDCSVVKSKPLKVFALSVGLSLIHI